MWISYYRVVKQNIPGELGLNYWHDFLIYLIFFDNQKIERQFACRSSQFAEDPAVPNCRCFHSRVFLQNFGALPRKYRAWDYCQVGLSRKISRLLLAYMLLLSYKRNVLLLKNWKDAHSQERVFNTQIINKMISTSNQNTGIQDYFFGIKFIQDN